MQKDLSLMLITCGETIRTSLQRLCDSGKGVLFLVQGGMLKGSLSDGDIRRYLLSGGKIDDGVMNAANRAPVFLFTAEREHAESVMTEKSIRAVPIVDDAMQIMDIALLHEQVPIDDVAIRELNENDLGIVLEFFDQMAGDTRAMFNRGDVNRIRIVNYLTAKSGKASDEIHFAAMVKTDDGLEKMVGYVFLWDTDKLLPWLGIAVREEWKGHQLGRRLMSWIDSWAKPKGYGGVMLTSVPANIRAHSLYVRMGYEYFGTYPDSEFLYIKRYSKEEV